MNQKTRPMERVNYFEGQLLTQSDFTDEQEYHLGKHRRHNLFLHGWGVVCGLLVVPHPDKPTSVMVEPGLALDPWGREIVVTEPQEGEVGERGCFNAIGLDRTRSVYLVVEYREEGVELAPAVGSIEPGSEGDMVPLRIRETFRLSLRKEPPEVNDGFGRQLCELVESAFREGMGQERLHASLCELLSQPCRPFAPDPALTLAKIDLPPQGPITAAEIDNCSHRHLALPVDRVLQILLCVVVSLAKKR